MKVTTLTVQSCSRDRMTMRAMKTRMSAIGRTTKRPATIIGAVSYVLMST
jgi:hypothetical protein